MSNNKKLKLYRVTCKGMTSNSGGGVIHGIAYVIALNSDEAYQKLRKYLDDRDLGFSGEREMNKVELIAEDYEYANCQTILFL